MNQPALKIVEKELIPFDIQELTKDNIDLMKQQILEIPEMPEDSKQYNSVRDMNVKAKKFLPRIEERRKELKAPVLKQAKEIDSTAKKAVAMVQPLVDLSGERRSAWEKVKKDEKAAKIKAEQDRLNKISDAIDTLSKYCNEGLQYGLGSDYIRVCLEKLKDMTVGMEVYQERSGEAAIMIEQAIFNTETALENRLKFEAEQAELEAAREAQAKAESEAKAMREAEEKALAAERQAIEAEKARIAAEEEAKKDALLYEDDWYEAHALNLRINRCISRGIAENQAIKDAEKKAEAERLEALKPDKEKLKDYLLLISEVVEPEMTTDDGKQWLIAVNDLIRQAVDTGMEFVNA